MKRVILAAVAVAFVMSPSTFSFAADDAQGRASAAGGRTPGAAVPSGKAVLATKCAICHGADRSLKKNKDANGWQETVDRMKEKGADISDAEAKAVVDYLVEVAGPKK